MPSRRALLAGAGGVVSGAALAETVHLGPIEADPPPSDTWTHARSGPTNTAANPAARTPTDPSIDWQTVELPNADTTSVVVDRDAVFVGGTGIVSLARADGTPHWRVDRPGTNLALGAGTLVATPGRFPADRYDRNSIGPMALDPDTGKRRWQARTGAGIYHVVVADGTVFVGFHGRLVAFDAGNGYRRWSVHEGWDAESFPMVYRGRLYAALERLVGFGSRSLLDVATLSGPPTRWETDYFDEMDAPTVVGDRLIVGQYHFHQGATDPPVYAFDARDGSVLWTALEPEAETDLVGAPTPAVVGDQGFVAIRYGTGKDRRIAVAGIDLEDGAVRWKRPVGQWIRDLAAGRNALVIGTGGEEDDRSSPPGTVRAYDRSDGRELWRISTEGAVTSVAMVDGTVFASTDRGGVMAIR